MVSVGTGFLYDYVPPEHVAAVLARQVSLKTVVPTVITNKHVIEGCDFVRVHLTVAPVNAPLDELGLASGRFHLPARLPVGANVVMHPDEAVDLCAIPAAWWFASVAKAGVHEVVHQRLWRGHRVRPEDRADIRFIEPVVMVGYPNGLWDSTNNSPIVRRGSTATHPLVAYEGRPEFIIDAACFPGSSGSPVFLYRDGYYSLGGRPHHGIRTVLIGVLYAGPQFTAQGVLQPVPIPHSVGAVPLTSIPMNLGYVINADQLDAFEPELLRRLAVEAEGETEDEA